MTRLRRDHNEVQGLIPWYVTGALDAADRAKVESHLADCPICQTELNGERRLDAEMASLPVPVEDGWATILRRLDAHPPKRAHGGLRGLVDAAISRLSDAWRLAPSWLGWSLAAPTALVLLVAGLVLPLPQQEIYHALGAPTASPSADVVVIFRPDTREADLRDALRAVGARLVGGPTAADTYLLNVPMTQRPKALLELRRRSVVMLAEPIDEGASP